MSIYNEDELVPPSWINREFIAKVLNEYKQKEDVVIMKFDIAPATMKGDHYASVMFRCKVDYRFGCLADRKSLIIKTLPMEEGAKRDMLASSKLFETEIDMYTKALPKIEEILAQYGEETRLSAKIIYHSLEPHKVLILEDLCETGFDVIRGRYLTEDEAKIVYKKVAKLHAVSYMLGHSENNEEIAGYQDGMFSLSLDLLKQMMDSGNENFQNMLSYYDEFDVFYEKFKAMKPDIEKVCRELYDAYKLKKGNNTKEIFVLNHGDFHLRNFMFKLNEQNQMEDVIMVDYQASCYAPSTIDMIYSQYMILSPELRLRKNEFMQYYFTEFLRILKMIEFKGDMPKYSDFQIANLKYRHFSLFLICTFLPMISGVLSKTVEELKDIEMNDYMENADKRAGLYHCSEFVAEMRQFLPILLSEGYLD